MKKNLKNYLYIGAIIFCILCFLYITQQSKEETIIEEPQILVKEDTISESYSVDIKGEVNNPGVYKISSNSRIIDAIEIAGGLTKNADTSLLNLSQKITDEMNIKVYSKEEVKSTKKALQSETDILYYIDIKGEVKNPGVYKISSNSRIIDAIKKAGGLTNNADTSLLNLSKKITDEMNIKIYSKEEVKTAKKNLENDIEVVEIIKEIEKECVCPDDNCSYNNDALIEDVVNKNSELDNDIKIVNINTASKEELMTIPNIGESKAENIIDHRNKTKFEDIKDILNVSGIGESLFEKIKAYITV